MGGRKTLVTTQKTKTKQMRLVQMLTPRRSARLCGDLAAQKEIKRQCKKDDKEDVNTQLLEVEVEENKTITLIKVEENSKGKQDVNAKLKSICSPKKDGVSVSQDDDEKLQLLKAFDMNQLYGPCRGISRRERYLRAIKYEIKPIPDEIILTILDERPDDLAFQKCIWDQNELLKLHI